MIPGGTRIRPRAACVPQVKAQLSGLMTMSNRRRLYQKVSRLIWEKIDSFDAVVRFCERNFYETQSHDFNTWRTFTELGALSATR